MYVCSLHIALQYLDLETECVIIRHPGVVVVDGRHQMLAVPHHVAAAVEELLTHLSTRIVSDSTYYDTKAPLLLLLLMVSSSLYVSHMFVTRVLSSLVFRVVLL